MMRVLVLTMATFLLMSMSLICSAEQDDQQELAELQAQIKQKQKAIESNLADVKQLQKTLRTSEINIANLAKALSKTQQQLTENQQQQRKLETQRDALKTQLAQQQDVLARQLRSAYMAGNHDYAKLLFNLSQAGKFERMLSYYQYLSKERRRQIDEFRDLGHELAQVVSDLQNKQTQLVALEKKQSEQQNTLKQQQKSREQTLASLRKKIDTEAARVEQLQINEQSLLQALQQARELQTQRSSDAPVTLVGLQRLKGKLPHPVSGRQDKLYGKRRQGQVRWKGIMFYQNEGAQVQAVQDARVLYADWLKGFGLVIALDHGDGYMSLYGHNQALLRDVGDEVHQGEAIALVGQSGGQTRPGLYFEIRHKGRPVNPTQWLTR